MRQVGCYTAIIPHTLMVYTTLNNLPKINEIVSVFNYLTKTEAKGKVIKIHNFKREYEIITS